MCEARGVVCEARSAMFEWPGAMFSAWGAVCEARGGMAISMGGMFSALSYVVTLFEVTGGTLLNPRGSPGKKKAAEAASVLVVQSVPVLSLCAQPLCSAHRESSHAPCVMAFSICRNVYV